MPKITPTPSEKRTEPYWRELNKVIDPEIGMGIVDLGLVYQVKIDKKQNCKIIMTLTTPTCPVGPMILQQVEDRMRMYRDINTIEVELVWDPAWTNEMIDEELREMMFGF